MVAAIAVAAVLFVIVAPLIGWPSVVRLPAVLGPALALILLIEKPWRWPGAIDRASTWQPSPRLVWSGALMVAVLLFWYVLTRFQSGQINAIDFTVYFDRPCFQTVQGRPLFVENSDTPGFSNRSELADHAYWALLPICSVYALHPTPLWLHGVSALALTAGAFYILRIMQLLGLGGVLGLATALAFILNDNTARAVNYGFHPEVLYAWFIPWMMVACLRGSRGPYLLAALGCVLVKEDAVFPILAASVGLALHRFREMTWPDRVLFLLLPTTLAVTNLLVYYEFVTPMLTGRSGPSYASFWGNYGDTPVMALLGMAMQPARVLAEVATSGIWSALRPHLYLPLIRWKWTLGVLPILLLYGASANEQLRAFGIYYAQVLVPFMVVAASMGALSLTRLYWSHEGRAQIAASVVILLGVLMVGAGHRGYSLRPWRSEVAAVPQALARLSSEPIVLMQSGLFPHAGYDDRVKLLTRESLEDPRNKGAAVVLAPQVGGYPFSKEEVASLAASLSLGPMPGGTIAVRLPK